MNKGLGFLREAVMAAKFGADIRMDGLLAGQTIPAVLSKVMDEVLGASLLPLFAAWTGRDGEAISWVRIKQIVRRLLLAGSVVILLLLVLSRHVIAIVAPGLAAEGKHIAVRSLQIMLPSILFFLLGSVLSAILNYYRRFFWSGLAATLGNAFSLLAILIYARQLDVYSVAIGITVGAISLVVFQVPFLPRSAHLSDTGPDARAPFAEFVRLAGPLSLAILSFNAIPLVERFLASSLSEGSLAILNYAFKVDWLVYTVLTVSVASVTFPPLAAAAAAQDTAHFRRILALGLKTVMLLIVPWIVVLFSLALPVIQLLFERGMFDAEQTARTASVLRIYVIGLPGASAFLLLSYALYASKQSGVRLVVSGLSVPLTFVWGWVFTRYWDVQGIAWAHVVTLSLMSVYMAWALRPWLGRFAVPALWFGVRVASAGLLSGAACVVAHQQLSVSFPGDSFLSQFVRIALPAAVAEVIFYVGCWVARVEEVEQLRGVLRQMRSVQARQFFSD